MPSEVKLDSLIINKVEGKALYQNLVETGRVNEDEIYIIEDDTPTVSDVKLNGQSVVSDGVANLNLNKNSVGLGNVNNTSDMQKPISTATQEALDMLQQNITSAVAAEASERQKQDNLLQDGIDAKLQSDDLVEGDNVTLDKSSQAGKVIISATDTKYTAGTGLGMIGNGFYLLNGGVGVNQLADKAVSASKLTDNAVITSKIKDGAVTAEKIADGVIPDTSQFITKATADSSYAAVGHKHSASDITSGTFALDRIPTITDAKISGISASKITGTISSSNLPSYVDDVLEYNGQSAFPDTGESGKIYVDTSTNKTYRWSGSGYTEISASLALGTTSSTAFRGDYGNTAYQHAVAKGSAFSSGLYKITTNTQGHVTAATAVTKNDIVSLGIPAQDTNTTYGLASTTANGLLRQLTGSTSAYMRADGTWATPPNTTYSVATDEANGLMSAADKEKLDGIATGANKYTLPTATSSVLGGVKTGANITNSSGTISLTKANVVAALGYTPPTTDTNTWIAFKGATTSAAGTAGYAPAPSAGAANRYLRSDGTWTVPPDTNTTYSNMKGATSSAAGSAGLVPAPAAGKQSSFLRGDGTWVVPTNTNTTYTLTKSGSTITLNGSDGSETSVTDSNTTYSLSSFGVTATATELNYMDGVTSNVQTQLNGKAASSHGHSNASTFAAGFLRQLDGSTSHYLRGDGTWGTPPNTTYSNMTGATSSAAGKAGLVPAPAAGAATRYLRSDGTWQVPPDTNTTYTLSSFGITATAAEINKLDGLTTTKTELGYLDGVTSNVQTQLNGKAASSHNHSAANITSGTLAVARGGTGITANPSMLVNLGSTSAASVFATSPRPGITGTLAVAHGGTGATSAASARSNLGAAASDIVAVQSSQPTSSTCKLWIKI